MPANNIPRLNKRIFWDVNFDTLDYDKNARFIIGRVFVRGNSSDIGECRRYYGDNLITEVLTNLKWLPLPAVQLACEILNNKLTDYKCYNLAQADPTHWLY